MFYFYPIILFYCSSKFNSLTLPIILNKDNFNISCTSVKSSTRLVGTITMPCSLFKILHRNEAIELKTSIHFPLQSFPVLLYTNQKQKIEFDHSSYVCLWIKDKSTSNHLFLCSVSLGNNAVPGKRSHDANILGPTRVQHFLCHHCLLVNCLCSK